MLSSSAGPGKPGIGLYAGKTLEYSGKVKIIMTTLCNEKLTRRLISVEIENFPRAFSYKLQKNLKALLNFLLKALEVPWKMVS